MATQMAVLSTLKASAEAIIEPGDYYITILARQAEKDLAAVSYGTNIPQQADVIAIFTHLIEENKKNRQTIITDIHGHA